MMTTEKVITSEPGSALAGRAKVFVGLTHECFVADSADVQHEGTQNRPRAAATMRCDADRLLRADLGAAAALHAVGTFEAQSPVIVISVHEPQGWGRADGGTHTAAIASGGKCCRRQSVHLTADSLGDCIQSDSLSPHIDGWPLAAGRMLRILELNRSG